MEHRFLDGPAGRLDSRWDGPVDGRPVLVIHPHPKYQGSMGSRFVYDLSKALVAEGYRAVRFDFRGVRRSDGHYDNGNGETEDALVAYDALAAESGQTPIVVGHSFGSSVALRVATMRDVRCVIAVATPARVYDSELDTLSFAADVRCPASLIIGEDDERVSVLAARAVAEAIPDLHAFKVLPGVGHFLNVADLPQGIAMVLGLLDEMLAP